MDRNILIDKILACDNDDYKLNKKINRGRLKILFDHNCDLRTYKVLDNVIQGDSIWNKIQKFYFRLINISSVNKRAKTYCRSYRILKDDKFRHITQYPHMIHPLSPFKKWWEFFMIFVYLISLITHPIMSAFCFLLLNQMHAHFYYKYSLDIICLVDIFINFFTAFYDETGKINFKLRSRARNYIKTRFKYDFLAAFPSTYLVIRLVHEEGLTMQFISVIFEALQLLRIIACFEYIRNFGKAAGIIPQKVKIFQIIIIVFILLHWISCFLIITGTIAIKFNEYGVPYHESWLTANDLWKNAAILIYMTSVYRASCFLMGGNYQSELAHTTDDYVVKIICWFLSKVIFAIGVGIILQFTYYGDSAEIVYRRKLYKLVQFLKQKEISKKTIVKVISFYEFKYENKFFNEFDILSNVSAKLREDILMYKLEKLLVNITFFKGLPNSLILNIAKCLRQEIFLSGDIILKSFSRCENLYLIYSGTVVVYTKHGIEVSLQATADRHLQDGGYFGDNQLLSSVSNVSDESFMALESCEIYIMCEKDFYDALYFITFYPDIQNRIRDHVDYTTLINKYNDFKYHQIQKEKKNFRKNSFNF